MYVVINVIVFSPVFLSINPVRAFHALDFVLSYISFAILFPAATAGFCDSSIAPLRIASISGCMATKTPLASATVSDETSHPSSTGVSFATAPFTPSDTLCALSSSSFGGSLSFHITVSFIAPKAIFFYK